MGKGELISVRMIKEHAKMLALLNRFMKNEGASLEELSNIQGSHAFAEEKAIMSFYKKKKDFELLNTILEEHEQMRTYLKEMKKDIKVAKKFEKLMKKHIRLENSKFYPMLDKDLTLQEQDEIFTQFSLLFNAKMKF